LAQSKQRSEGRLIEQILGFCRWAAGSCEISAVAICGNYAFGLTNPKATIEVLLVVRDFLPRLISYVRVFDERNVVVFAVDAWVFERDVDRGFLGEAMAGLLIFPYIALMKPDYLRTQEEKLKKRLITELLTNLVLDFPELSRDIHIRPEYFMYETMLSRVRLFPPMTQSLLVFMQDDVKDQNVKRALDAYLKALKELQTENTVVISNEYIKISENFAERVKTRRVRFVNLFKTVPRALFTSLLGIIPRVLDIFSQNRDTFLRFPKVNDVETRIVHSLEVPQRYLYIPTSRGLVPLANKGDIAAFARNVLALKKDAPIEITEIGGMLNDVYLVKASVNGEEKKVVVKWFREWSSFKWFPLTLWTVGTRTFAVSGRSRLEREAAINQLLDSSGFDVPRILHVIPDERLVFMEYVGGRNVGNMIKKLAVCKSPWIVKKDLKTINRVGKKLAKVHSLGIALGDTKPENVMIGEHGEIFLEQAARNGDKVWDVAEFLYYAGHDIPPLAGAGIAERIAKAFVEGYLEGGGKVETVKKAGTAKYTKVFSVFTLPLIMLTVSNLCRNADKLKV
jgi:tRNA A-37 threonylcarbamoyl transferase component Bud32